MSDVNLLADARDWLATQGDRIQTHGELCHRWHPACLVGRLVREVERLIDHDAAPAAKAQLPSGGHASSGGGSDRTDKPVTRPAGTGNTRRT